MSDGVVSKWRDRLVPSHPLGEAGAQSLVGCRESGSLSAHLLFSRCGHASLQEGYLRH